MPGSFTCYLILSKRRPQISSSDERSWQVVYHDYHQQLRFPVEPTTRQTVIDDAFVKMTGSFPRYPEKFAHYLNLAALLGLPRCCAQRVVQDYVTDRRQDLSIVPLEAVAEPASAATLPPLRSGLPLEGLLHDEKEWLVVTSLLVEEAKPRQLYAEQPELFASVDEINTIGERVKGRLQRNDEMRHYLLAMVGQ